MGLLLRSTASLISCAAHTYTQGYSTETHITAGGHTEERTPSLHTRFGDSSHNSFRGAEVEFPTGKVIEEEEGLCSLCQNVIYTHSNQVLANGIMFIALLGNLENNRNIHMRLGSRLYLVSLAVEANKYYQLSASCSEHLKTKEH